MAQLDVYQTCDQEVTVSIPSGSGNILSWRVIMKYFLCHSLPFPDSKKSSCPFLMKEYVQELVNHLDD